MSLLLVGQTTLLSQLHMEDYIPRESIVISTDYPSSFHTSRHHVTTTDITFGQNGWERMFEIHDFDRVLYLSGLLDPLGGEPRETAQLFETLLYAGQRGVKHFYICLPDMKAEADGSRRRGYAEGLKNVASLFSSREGFDIKILYVPYIANPDDRNNFVLQIRNEKSLRGRLPWVKDAGVPFAEAETFLAWMKTVIENDGAKAGELTLNADFTVLFDDDMFREKHLVACSRPSEVRQSLLSRQKQDDDGKIPL